MQSEIFTKSEHKTKEQLADETRQLWGQPPATFLKPNTGTVRLVPNEESKEKVRKLDEERKETERKLDRVLEK